MDTHFKSALNQIKADPKLIMKTERLLIESRQIHIKERRLPFTMKRSLTVASMILMLFVFSLGIFAAYTSPVAYVSVDINPSIELSLNVFNKVIEAFSYNKDGTAILDSLSLKGKTVDDAINTTVNSAIEKGYILSDGSTVILITSETKKLKLSNTIDKLARDGATSALNSMKKTAVIQSEHMNVQLRSEAANYNLSPAKYNLIRTNIDDSSESFEELRTMSMKEIMIQIELERQEKNINTEQNENTKEIQNNIEDHDNQEQNNNNDANSKAQNTVSEDSGQGNATIEDVGSSNTNQEPINDAIMNNKQNSSGTQGTEDNIGGPKTNTGSSKVNGGKK